MATIGSSLSSIGTSGGGEKAQLTRDAMDGGWGELLASFERSVENG